MTSGTLILVRSDDVLILVENAEEAVAVCVHVGSERPDRGMVTTATTKTTTTRRRRTLKRKRKCW